MRNATPPGQVALRLQIAAGSLHERDDERGVAHFIEHMLFNGTKNVPGVEFLQRLERLGLRRGVDANATTDFTQTVLRLNLPNGRAETVDTAMLLLREAVDEATFNAEAIERERGVILAEERTRSTPQLRVSNAQLGFLLKDDLLPNRFPIGSTEIVKTVGREQLLKFYERYYRPDRATFLAIGDFDPDAMEKTIRTAFESWKPAGAPGADPAPANLAARSLDSQLLVEPGAPSQIVVSWLSPADLRPDSLAKRKQRLIEQLALQIIGRRLQALATSPSPPLTAGIITRAEPYRRALIIHAVAVPQPGKWEEALRAIDEVQRRAVQFGFTQAELAREVAAMRTQMTNEVNSSATRPTPALADAMSSPVAQYSVYAAPGDGLVRFEETVRNLTAREVSAAAAALFQGSGPLIWLTTATPLPGGSESLLTAYRASNAKPVAALAAGPSQGWPYDSFGTPGQITERREIAGLDATALRFANGVRLTVRPSKLAKDEVLVSVRIGRGRMEMSPDKPNPEWALSGPPGIGGFGFTGGGLGKISYEAMLSTLAGTTWSASTQIEDDAFVLLGKTRPQDFARQMQILAAYVKDPGWRPTAWNQFRAAMRQRQDTLGATPRGVYARDAEKLLHSGDGRWGLASREEIESSSIADARQLLEPALAQGPLEVIIAGDISLDEAIREAAATFGALGARPDRPLAAKQVAFPSPGSNRLAHKGRADQAMAFVGWPTPGVHSDHRRTRVLQVVGEVLRLRLTEQMREKQGAAYTPEARLFTSRTIDSYGYVASRVEVPPEKFDAVFADILAAAADLRARPISADELQRARQPYVEGRRRARLLNSFWLEELGGAQENPKRADYVRTGIDMLMSITPEDIMQAARQYLVDEKAVRLMIAPEAAQLSIASP